MERTAYVSVTYLFTVDPEMVGLDKNCTKEELEKATEKYMEAVTDYIAHQADVFPNDVEIYVND